MGAEGLLMGVSDPIVHGSEEHLRSTHPLLLLSMKFKNVFRVSNDIIG